MPKTPRKTAEDTPLPRFSLPEEATPGKYIEIAFDKAATKKKFPESADVELSNYIARIDETYIETKGARKGHTILKATAFPGFKSLEFDMLIDLTLGETVRTPAVLDAINLTDFTDADMKEAAEVHAAANAEGKTADQLLAEPDKKPESSPRTARRTVPARKKPEVRERRAPATERKEAAAKKRSSR